MAKSQRHVLQSAFTIFAVFFGDIICHYSHAALNSCWRSCVNRLLGGFFFSPKEKEQKQTKGRAYSSGTRSLIKTPPSLARIHFLYSAGLCVRVKPASAVLGAEELWGIDRCNGTAYNRWTRQSIDSAALLSLEKPNSGSQRFLQRFFLGPPGQSFRVSRRQFDTFFDLKFLNQWFYQS